MIVVATNVLAYLYLPGERTADAEALFERDPEWAVPVLWRSEFGNILAGYTRRKTLTFDLACSLHSEAEDLLSGAEFEVNSRAVLELARDSTCSAYDCEFMALAIKLNTKLVTADKKLLRAFPALTRALTAASPRWSRTHGSSCCRTQAPEPGAEHRICAFCDGR